MCSKITNIFQNIFFRNWSENFQNLQNRSIRYGQHLLPPSFQVLGNFQERCCEGCDVLGRLAGIPDFPPLDASVTSLTRQVSLVSDCCCCLGHISQHTFLSLYLAIPILVTSKKERERDFYWQCDSAVWHWQCDTVTLTVFPNPGKQQDQVLISSCIYHWFWFKLPCWFWWLNTVDSILCTLYIIT